jgi:response regulator NasT
MRILLAEKDTLFRKSLAGMLTQAGYTVVGEAGDGATALKMLRTLQPEMFMVAANLPGITGLELANIAEESRLSAVIMLVEYAEKDVIHNNDEHWSFPVLVKPFDQLHMLSMVEYTFSVFNKMVNLEDEIRRLKDDLLTRKTVEKAKGILMKTHGLSEEQAFRRIQQQSMKKRTSMKTIAEAIITAFEV